MAVPRPLFALGLGVLVCAAGACSGLAAIEGPGPALSAEERQAVRAQAEGASGARAFRSAWSQEVAAGADRDRLEDVALAALSARSTHAAAMFEALRAKWGSLSARARGRADELVATARAEGAWERAVEVELVTADDPPAYARAWALYEAAPATRAEALLEAIRDARAEHAEPGD